MFIPDSAGVNLAKSPHPFCHQGVSIKSRRQGIGAQVQGCQPSRSIGAP